MEGKRLSSSDSCLGGEKKDQILGGGGNKCLRGNKLGRKARFVTSILLGLFDEATSTQIGVATRALQAE
jgi:hypothetical protein